MVTGGVLPGPSGRSSHLEHQALERYNRHTAGLSSARPRLMVRMPQRYGRIRGYENPGRNIHHSSFQSSGERE